MSALLFEVRPSDPATLLNVALLLLVIAGLVKTVFQTASLSKWITAWGVMGLAQDRKIDMDAGGRTCAGRTKGLESHLNVPPFRTKSS